ncbi:MAG: hypothetical protein ACFFDK_11110 [Promethearchaeota archaeon]
MVISENEYNDVIIGKCPVCGRYLTKEYGYKGRKILNYTTCVVCNELYCLKCANYKLCPTHFSVLSPKQQRNLISYYERTLLMNKIAFYVSIPIFVFLGVIIVIVWMDLLITLIFMPSWAGFYFGSNYYFTYLYKKKANKLSRRTIN